MAKLITLQPAKTYATIENAIKAVEKKYPSPGFSDEANLTYFIHREEATGRYFPVFLGERAIRAMVHFNFNVVA